MADNGSGHQHTNRLIDENSPYLLQHAHNPVDWYPWGDEALERAKKENKPIFLSIGYSACHWCHVMERESFESDDVAAILNKHYVSIKVDREQRPDIDQIYMSFTMALTGAGGWPMSVFLTPDLKPFFAGTYFPPEDHMGRPGFKRVLSEIAAAWDEIPQQITQSAESIFEQIQGFLRTETSDTLLNPGMITRSVSALMKSFDKTNGGFGQAPKFPHGIELSLFLRYYKASGELDYLKAAEQALTAMADGGIYDHLGGGFARYSTDARWLVPHFEKMLYDNALLVPVYAEAYQVTGNERYREVVIETLDFILREMTDNSGGFYSALDADSEGEEGKFYVWDKSEIDSVLGDDADLFCRYYNVSESGNWEGTNILHRDASSERVRKESKVEDFDAFIAGAKEKLFDARTKRVRPGTDDKTLTSWNGLALTAFTRGYQITGEKRFLRAAIKNAEFVREKMFADGRLSHAYRDGNRTEGEFLEDYAFYVCGLLDLYETDIKKAHRWINFAERLANRAIEIFQDTNGHFFLRPEGIDDLIIRPRDETDGAIPAPGSLLLHSLIKLNRITGEKDFLRAAEAGLRAVATQVEKYPAGMAAGVIALQYYTSDKVEIVIVGDGDKRDAMVNVVYEQFMPNRVLAVSDDGNEQLPLFEGREPDNGNVQAFVCRNSVCRLPVGTVEELKAQLSGL